MKDPVSPAYAELPPGGLLSENVWLRTRYEQVVKDLRDAYETMSEQRQRLNALETELRQLKGKK